MNTVPGHSYQRFLLIKVYDLDRLEEAVDEAKQKIDRTLSLYH